MGGTLLRPHWSRDCTHAVRAHRLMFARRVSSWFAAVCFDSFDHHGSEKTLHPRTLPPPPCAHTMAPLPLPLLPSTLLLLLLLLLSLALPRVLADTPTWSLLPTAGTVSPRAYASGLVMPTAFGKALAQSANPPAFDDPIWTEAGMEQFVLLAGHRLPEVALPDILTADAADPTTWVNQHDDTSNPTPWPVRFSAVALRADPTDRTNTKIYLIGGQTLNADKLSDVWSTEDPTFRASSWTLLSADAFPGRSAHCAVALDRGETVFVWAGNPTSIPFGDAWISVNGGRNFTAAGDPRSIYWTNRFAASCTAIAVTPSTPAPTGSPANAKEVIWMIAGEGDSRRQPLDEVWFTADRGVSWHQQPLRPFTGGRRSFAATVYASIALANFTSGGDVNSTDLSVHTPALLVHGGVSPSGYPAMHNSSAYSEDSVQSWKSLSSIPNEAGRSGHVLLVNAAGRTFILTGQIWMPEGDMAMETGEVWRYEHEEWTPPENSQPGEGGGSGGSDEEDDAAAMRSRWLTLIIGLILLLVGLGLLALAGHFLYRRHEDRKRREAADRLGTGGAYMQELTEEPLNRGDAMERQQDEEEEEEAAERRGGGRGHHHSNGGASVYNPPRSSSQQQLQHLTSDRLVSDGLVESESCTYEPDVAGGVRVHVM
jgi:hypothetical protein